MAFAAVRPTEMYDQIESGKSTGAMPSRKIAKHIQPKSNTFNIENDLIKNVVLECSG